jgi:hypothetical protein
MRRFHVVGVTEKELGSNILDRLITVASIRCALDRAALKNLPLHVWGGLDPIMTPLYFCAGAELFDGVSWLRYGYANDCATTRDAYTVLEGLAQTPWRRAEAIRLAKNLSYLETATIHMRQFVDHGGTRFDVLGERHAVIEQTVAALYSELKGGQ